MIDDPDRRAALAAAKLGALVRSTWADADPAAASGSFPGGAVLTEPDGGRLWLFLEDAAVRRVGAALALAERSGARELHLLVTDGPAAEVVARRAALFADPPTVWHVDGATVQAAVAAAPATDPAPAPEAELYRPVLIEAGLEVVAEGGHLLGEVLGLETARVVVDERGAHIEAGVGRFDREVAAMMFAHLGELDSLARAVELVTAHRRAGEPRHPLNQLVPERWLRSVIVSRPELVGAQQLHAVGSAVPRANLKEAGVATAVGTDLDGRPLVVTATTGVDLEAVPAAADDRLAHAPDARLVLAVPAADALPVTTALAAHLRVPAEVVAIPGDWRSLLDDGRS